MKRYLPTMLALLFLFAFVFSFTATVTADVAPTDYTCQPCCVIKATGKCTAGRGMLRNNRCTCIRYPCIGEDPCTYVCPVCE